MPCFCRCPNCCKKLEIRNFLMNEAKMKREFANFKNIDKYDNNLSDSGEIKFVTVEMICSCGAKFNVGEESSGRYFPIQFWEE